MSATKEQSGTKFLSPVGVQDILVLAALYSIVAFSFSNFADHASLGWHLRSGQAIVEHHAVSQVDPFLFSASPRAWSSPSWLADLVFWNLFSYGSWPVLYGVVAIIFASTYLALLYGGLSGISGQRLGSSLGAGLAFLLAFSHFQLLPAVFGYFFFALAYLSCIKLDAAMRAAPAKIVGGIRKVFLTLPFVVLVWANFDASYLLGLLLILLLLISLSISAFLGILSPENSVGRKLIALFVLFVLASGLSVASPSSASVLSAFWHRPAEFLSDTFPAFAGSSQPVGAAPIVQVIVALLVFTAFFCGRLRSWLSLFEVMLILGFALLGYLFEGSLPYFGIVCSFPLARIFSALGSEDSPFAAKKFDRMRAVFRSVETREHKSLGGSAILSALLILLLVDSIAHRKVLSYEGPFGPSVQAFPYGAAEFLKQMSIEDGNVVVAAPPAWGGFLALYAREAAQPIIDDRLALLGHEFYVENASELQLGADWSAYLTKMQAGRLLLPRTDPLAITLKELGDAFALYEDNVAILFDLRSVR